MEYDLELDRVLGEIKRVKARRVLVQLPDGLKPRASEIVDYIQNRTKVAVFIWMGSCWGACDYPDIKEIDLLVQFGHAAPNILEPVPG